MQDVMYKLSHSIVDDYNNEKDARNLALSIWNSCLNKYQQHQVYLHYFIDEVLKRQAEAIEQVHGDETDCYFKNNYNGKPYVKEDADKQDEITTYFIETVATLQKNNPKAAESVLTNIKLAYEYDLLKAINVTSTDAVCKHLLNMLWEVDKFMTYLKDTAELREAKAHCGKLQAALTCYLNNADLPTDSSTGDL